jgi:hypothetical protein
VLDSGSASSKPAAADLEDASRNDGVRDAGVTRGTT